MAFTSWNRLRYDPCEYKQTLTQSTDPLGYMLFPPKFESPDKCRNQLGLVAGNDVSNVRGNMVDLESDLFGITRNNTKCDAGKYKMACDIIETSCQPRKLQYKDRATGVIRDIDTRLGHQKACQFASYPAVPAPAPLRVPGCNMSRY